MQVQNLPFLGFGYLPWGSGAPGVASPASGGGASGSSSSSNAGSSSSSVGSDLSSAVSNLLSGGASGNGVTSSVSELAVVRESETLKIQMADGAQVTLRMRAQGAAFGTAQTQADGSSSAAAGIFSSGQLQVSVSGNLSDADKKAISDVVSQVNSLATQFFSGDVQDAFAAASSLNVDPAEIAGFSLKLSYSSTLIQQASASSAGSPASSQSGTTPPNNTTTPTDTTSDPTSAAAATSSTAPAADASSAPANNTPSPQQVIIAFMQKVMTTLGRSSDSTHGHSHLAASSRWKLHLLAQALPAYAQAQAQAGAGSQGTAASQTDPASQATPPSGTPQGVTPAMAPAPQTTANRYPTLQAAKLAADTVSQLAQ